MIFESSAPEEEKIIAWKKFEQLKGKERLKFLDKFYENRKPSFKNLLSTSVS